jgi:uncharacterized iron-regulated protein
MRLAAFLMLSLGLPAQAEPITPQRLDALSGADIVILGETHDNPHHHAGQARAIAALRPAALVWEMLTEAQARRMPERREDARQVAGALGWEGTGWPDFSLYFPLVQAAGSARHYGAAVPRAEARRAFAEGAAAVFAGDAAAYGLADPLDAADQAAREAEQFDAHCAAMPMDMMRGMVEAQRLRDAELARVALLALAETGGPVVVIAGSGHARRDQGIPAAVSAAAPGVGVLSLAFLEAPPAAPLWDLWLVTPPAERDDPCAALQ